MAAASTTAVAASLSAAGGLGLRRPAASLRPSSPRAAVRRVAVVRASAQQPVREKAVAGLAAAAVAAALVLPEVAEAAQPGLSPSLKNFLLSIASGGVVLVALVGAVVAVSNFDPVKRA